MFQSLKRATHSVLFLVIARVLKGFNEEAPQQRGFYPQVA